MIASARPTPQAPTLFQVLQRSVPRLAMGLGARYVWTCVRLPDEPSFVLDCVGPRPAGFPLVVLEEASDQAEAPVVAIIPLRFLQATLEIVVGRARPLTRLEGRRLKTWRRRTQDELQDATLEHLAAMVESQEARQRAHERHQARLAHDAVNSLVPALHALEFLAETDCPAERRRCLEVSERCMLDAHGLLRESLQPMRRRLSCHDWRAIALPVIEAWGLPLAEHGRFEVLVSSTPLEIRAPAADLRSIVANLLSNAHKYTPPGTTITLQLAAEGARARLEVTDDGPGIPDALRPHLFVPGSRGPGSQPGSGLGLADVARLVAGLGGEWEVANVPGASFRIYLPLAQGSP